MNLRDRLSQLQRQAGAQQPASTPHAAETVANAESPPRVHRESIGVRERLTHIRPERALGRSTTRAPRSTTDELARQLGGDLIADGLIQIEHKTSLTNTHGCVPLSLLAQRSPLPGHLAVDPANCVYFDTETTGLSGGAGTVAFLIGIARIETGHLQVTQWLATRFAAEPALLGCLAGALKNGDELVSYNGKSFDAPLLGTRFRMHGRSDALAGLSHLDLLHPMRRLFARNWPDCRLQTVETRLLNYHRVGDLPGSEAPQAWFDWLHRGEAERLVQIGKHNRQDLISLAAAHAALSATCASAPHNELDLAALANWIGASEPERARALLLREHQRLDDRALRLLARLHRRAGDWLAALVLWQDLATRGCQESLGQLAKYHEHRSKDYPTALTLSARLQQTPDARRRLERLRGKLEQVLL